MRSRISTKLIFVSGVLLFRSPCLGLKVVMAQGLLAKGLWLVILIVRYSNSKSATSCWLATSRYYGWLRAGICGVVSIFASDRRVCSSTRGV